MRFVHTADWQLGMTRHFLAGEAQPRYSAARRDAVAGLGSLAADASAEFVVVAGDVFEHNQLAPQVISQSLEAMRAIGIAVYLLPGNHDPLDASSVYTSALFKAECPANVTVLDRAGIHEVRPGLQIVAAPWRSKAPTTDLVADVLDGIHAARDAGFGSIKVNMVVKRGTNDQEIVPMARHFRGTGVVLRFIEYMDVGTSNGWNMTEVLPSADVIARIAAHFPLVPLEPHSAAETAQRWGYADGSGEIGVISSVT